MNIRSVDALNQIRVKSMGSPAQGMHLQLDVGDHNGNKVPCPADEVPCSGDKASSPDSMRSNSSLSSASRESPADVEMMDCSLSMEVFSEGFPSGTALTNEDFGLPSLQRPACGQKEGPGEGCASVTSISSGEMLVRKNSFSLDSSESGKLLSASFLEEASAASSSATSDIVLPDVCEGLQERTSKPGDSGGDVDSQDGRLVHFPQAGGEDTYLAVGRSPPSLPSGLEVKDGQSADAAFILAEPDCSSPPLLYKTYVECELVLYSSGQHTPVEGGTFLVCGSEESDSSCNLQTSTPVQGSIKNMTFCLPSMTESPFASDHPSARTSKGKPRATVPPSPVVLRTPTTAAKKQAKTDAKSFPTPDLKNVKSKITTRPSTPQRASNSARTVPTPSKPALSKQCEPPAGPPVQKKRKGEGKERVRSQTTSFTVDKGAKEKPRPRRLSECDPASRPKPLRNPPAPSPQRVTAISGGTSINNVTFNASPAAPEQGDQKKTLQEDCPQAGSRRRSVADPGETKAAAKLCTDEQEAVAPATKPSVPVAAAAATDGGRAELGLRPSPSRGRGGASASQTPAANLRLPPPAPKQSASCKDGRTLGSMSAPRTKQPPAPGNPKIRLSERVSNSAAVAPGTKPALGSGLAAPRPGGVSRLPVKAREHEDPGTAAGDSQGSVPAVCKPDGKPARPGASVGPAPRHAGKPPLSRTGVRNVVQSPQRKASNSGIKNAALPNQPPSKSAASPLHRTGSGRFQRPVAPPVDKARTRPSSRTPPQSAPTPGQPDLLPTQANAPATERYLARCESDGRCIQLLKKLLSAGNRRFEALAMVLQHTIAEHEESLKQKQELAQELVTLRGELVNSSTSCEALQREKDELRVAFEGILQKVQQQHQSDMADLEERLKAFYSAEWEKVHQAYQEEADRCRGQMELQLEDLKSKHEASRTELEGRHAESLETLRQQYKTSVEELRKTHQEEMETMDKSLKEAEAKLTEQIEELTAENQALKEKVEAEEDRRRMLAEKNQKDSHTLYLEQELESLKVVLDIKNKQLHQQDKKLMQLDKLTEKNVKLEENIKKVQQENEDLKARMDKHAELSRQLSTEQAVLQESLQKESNVNKRLSMENEELLWKLHNGDLSSPRKLSPSSPSKGFPTPRNSAVLSSAPVSPR
ncbi:hypothetical protein GJAV_G00165260 [Gymnothorax javanicus]|nr:hypothetical protein GJAV_G00165260 [Gymnothorax javanicus]